MKSYLPSFLLLFSLTLLISTSQCKTAEEWKSRAIYQILTDRFDRGNGDLSDCKNMSNYCGGTFKGIEQNLDYIQGMGFNAIWISPVAQNAPGGYHGYWYTNMYKINEHFGTEQDLKDLVNALHARDMWIMVDVVPNHVANVPWNQDFSGIFPFNDKKYYHWPVRECQWIDDHTPYNQTGLELCWLSFLPDLDQENPFVKQTLIEWVRDFVNTYQIDGLRLDATRHIPKWFWYEFNEAAGVFNVGEVFNHDVAYCASYQGPVASLLNFPLHGTLEKIYRNESSMLEMKDFFEFSEKTWPNHDVVCNFVNNHDLLRWLYHSDIESFKALYAYVFSTVGIPVAYYGDEQSFHGGVDPLNRETLWGKKDTSSEMYQFFRTILTFREKTKFYTFPQIQRMVDETIYTFTRGHVFFAFTNSKEVEVRDITQHEFPEGTLLCNILNPKQCTEVKDGSFQITLTNREVKIMYPQHFNDEGVAQSKAWKQAKEVWVGDMIYDLTKQSLSGSKQI